MSDVFLACLILSIEIIGGVIALICYIDKMFQILVFDVLDVRDEDE